MARAVLFTGPGAPLEVVDCPTPRPGPGEVLVRVDCCTLCRSDLHTHAGRRGEATPAVLGHEAVGRIEAFGPGAARADAAGAPAGVGTRVSWAVAVGCGKCYFCGEGLPQKCTRPYKYGHVATPRTRPGGGGLADYLVLVPGTAWYLVPDGVPDRVAAPANCATATAVAVLRAAGDVRGRNVLVLGAGVLGVTACALARAAGARRVAAVDPSDGARRRARTFGADAALEPGDRLREQVAGLTEGRGADVLLELAGTADSVRAGLDLARVGGTVILAGTVAPVGGVALDPEAVVRRLLTIRGVHNYHPRDLGAALQFLAGAGRDCPFVELVGEAFPLAEVAAAFARAHASPGTRVAVLP